ncbi:MAG: hypothetical protein WBC04_23345 [Candidatus Acidiferrales bacterium]
MTTDTTTVQAVLETMYDEEGKEIPLKKFPVSVQLTEKSTGSDKFAEDTALSGIKLLSGTVPPDGNYYTLVFTHRGKNHREPCRVNGGKLLSQG